MQEMQARSSYEHLSVRLSVRPSVHLSVKCVDCDKTKQISADILLWKGNSSSFLARRMVGEGRPLLLEFFRENWPCRCKNGDFQSIFARSGSALRTSEKSSIITNRKSTTNFPIMMSLRWTAYADIFSSKSVFSLLQSFFVWNLSAAKL